MGGRGGRGGAGGSGAAPVGSPTVFDHVTIRVTDRAASEAFYDTMLGVLGIEKTHSDQWLVEWDDFGLSPASGEKHATRGLHVGFAARTREQADEFWRAGPRRATATTARPDRARSMGPTTTGPSCSTPTATAPRPCITGRCEPAAGSTTVDPRGRPRRRQALLPHDRAPRRPAPRHRRARAHPVQGCGRLVLARRRDADGARAPRVPRERRRDPGRGSTATRRRPATATTAARASAPSTTRGTTVPSSVIRTATTSRW